MGCDYYINRFLEIIHRRGIAYYSLKRVRCYYSDFSIDHTDTDEDFSEDETERQKDLEKIRESYITLMLRPSKPKVLYKNGDWTNQIYKDKYLVYVENCIEEEQCYKNSGDRLNNFLDIIEIRKIEERSEV